MNRIVVLFGVGVGLCIGLATSGCGGEDFNPGGNPATGGKVSATGGSVTTGGTASGGGSATGGDRASGGTTTVGGSTATGGTSGMGGSTANGGTAAKGGANSTGGATGGSATGGTTPGGGATGTGGSAGTQGNGGSTANGGTTSTGGAAGGAGGGGGTGTPLSCIPSQKKIVVAAGGGGDFTTIQAAVDSLPAGNKTPTLIFIKNGTYKERVLMEGKSFVTFRGEDRKLTKIEVQAATKAVCGGGDDKYGCALMCVKGGQDVAFDNFTIANTWDGDNKAIAWRTYDSTRIILKDMDIPGKAGDTHYTSGPGLHYYTGIYLSGTYHILVPRNTMWISDSVIDCLDATKCLFNESKNNDTEKLVIRNTQIKGVKGFTLGSYFRTAAWYFIDVNFDPNLADKPIYREQETSALGSWNGQWFAGSTGSTLPWLKDNIASSPAKTKEAVTAKWVFPNWDPGSSLICPQ